MTKTILFVCTGNTCRSPMCAALFNEKYAGDFHAVSAGLYADGSPISRNAVTALQAMGVKASVDNDYIHHVSHIVTENDVADALQVFGVTPSHAMQLRRLYPEYADKISSLPSAISDPFGSDAEVYKQCLRDIDKALEILFKSSDENTERSAL